MTNGSQRQSRLRLARQRSAPNRIRARLRKERFETVSDAGTSQVRHAWQRARRVGWTHVVAVAGTVLAAVAAVGGLWAQAVATYWSQQTAKDQLSQSKEEDVRRVRNQAAKVTYWGGGGSAFKWGGTGTLPSAGDGSGALHVLNRSPDPVPRASIAVEITGKSPDGEIRSEVWVMSLSSIPPCSHIEYQESELHRGYFREEGGESETLSGEEGVWAPVSMHFTDTRGVEWMRTQTSLEEGSAPKSFARAASSRMEIVGTGAKVHKAELCNDAS
ncbi:hypothetical protein [Streptomyces thermolineatus]|uniref:hypothetical protein n=1 Tax=Streptomyces thermolineatus TaxID=44033 RepID=UPI00384B0962